MTLTSPQIAAFRASPLAQCIVRGRDRLVLDASGGWQALFGLAREETVGRTLDDLAIFVNPETFLAELARCGTLRDTECELRTSAGAVLRGAVSVEPFENENEAYCLVVVRDTMSEISSAVAHLLNQPLAAIMANALAGLRFMQRDPIDVAELMGILEDIVADDRRATEIISRARALVQGAELEPPRPGGSDAARGEQ